ncbi:MAG: cellulose binding domain-containing protein, partial [Pseudomonadota bacterium]
MAEIATDRLSFSGRVREAWDGGGIVDMRLDATRPVNGWEVTVDVGGEIVNIWNARVLGREGALYRLGPLDYNTQLAAGAVADIGVQIEGTPRFAPVGADAVLASDVAEGVAPPPPPAPPSDTGPATLTGTAAPRQVEAQGGGLGTDAQTYAPSTLSFRESAPDGSEGVRVSGVTVPEPAGSGEGLPGDDFAPGPFSTRGATIIDAAGDRAVIHGTNWFGLETDISTVHGLWARNWRAIM